MSGAFKAFVCSAEPKLANQIDIIAEALGETDVDAIIEYTNAKDDWLDLYNDERVKRLHVNKLYKAVMEEKMHRMRDHPVNAPISAFQSASLQLDNEEKQSNSEVETSTVDDLDSVADIESATSDGKPAVVAEAPSRPWPSRANMLFKNVTSALYGLPQAYVAPELPASFQESCDALAFSIKSGEVPQKGIDVLLQIWQSAASSGEIVDDGTDLAVALAPFMSSCDLDDDAQPSTSEEVVAERYADDVDAASTVDDFASAADIESAASGGKSAVDAVAPSRPSPSRANMLFKNVTNALYGLPHAYVSSGLPVSFQESCDALAFSIKSGEVPQKGIDVLLQIRRSATPSAVIVDGTDLAVALAPFMSRCDLDDDAQPSTSEEVEKETYADEVDASSTVDDLAPDADIESAGLDGKPEVEVVTPSRPAPSKANMLFKNVTNALHGSPQVYVDPELPASFQESCDALAHCIKSGEVPRKGIDVLLQIWETRTISSGESIEDGTELAEALVPFMCPRCQNTRPRCSVCDKCSGKIRISCSECSGSGRFTPPCRPCKGTGRGRTKLYCPVCRGSGAADVGQCRGCRGNGGSNCTSCAKNAQGGHTPLCKRCCTSVKREEDQRRQFQQQRGSNVSEIPAAGMSITKASQADLSRLQELWVHRGGQGQVTAVWKVDNPLRTHLFMKRREQLKSVLRRQPDGLEGFHGTHPQNVMSICENGFRKDLRAGQVYGAGEYFAKNPMVSIGYAKGGQYMLVCRLTLGVPSSAMTNQDGDHIWAAGPSYYVIKEPEQVLPQFIIQFTTDAGYYGSVICPVLEGHLERGYNTKMAEEFKPVPPNRPCTMSRPHATVLWIGFLHANIEDERLAADVANFLKKYARAYTGGMKIQVVKGHFKKAHVILQEPMPKAVVHSLNSADFEEDGQVRRVCVNDAHGSPDENCKPRYIAGYCRGQNLRFTHPCFCRHPAKRTANAKYQLTPIDLSSAKAMEITDKMMASAPFHTGQTPKVVGINSITNKTLEQCHEEYRDYLKTKHMEEPAVQELYHGTNNNILDILYQHGLQPPSDMRPSDACPVSGKKGLCTSLCDNTCKFCIEKHEWNKCHMYGLGIYLADMAQKSHRYTSHPKLRGGREVYRMVICSVLGKSFQIEGYLKADRAMHDVVNVRALDSESLDEMVDLCQPCANSSAGLGAYVAGANGETWGRVVADEGHCWRLHTGRKVGKETEGSKWNWTASAELSAESIETSAEKSDLLFIKGLGNRCRPGYSVVNSEFIAFHPHQCLPKYEIEYEMW